MEARLRAPTTEQRDVLRARIVLLAAESRSTRSIARLVDAMPRTVSLWRGRFARQALAGLLINQVEIWFSIVQGQSLRGASFASVKQLRAHIDAFIAAYNKNSTPFVWTKAKVRQRRLKGRRISQL